MLTLQMFVFYVIEVFLTYFMSTKLVFIFVLTQLQRQFVNFETSYICTTAKFFNSIAKIYNGQAIHLMLFITCVVCRKTTYPPGSKGCGCVGKSRHFVSMPGDWWSRASDHLEEARRTDTSREVSVWIDEYMEDLYHWFIAVQLCDIDSKYCYFSSCANLCDRYYWPSTFDWFL